MPAYVVVGVDVFDEEAALAYAAVAQRSILDQGGRYLVAGPTPEPVEGAFDFARFLLIEFPDMDRARRWYESPEYQRARAMREGAAEVRMFLAESSPPEGFTLPAA